jgi:hypothetical protein
MSDSLINIRILMWHFKMSNRYTFSVSYNDYHKGLKHGWFDICEFRLFKR